MNCWIVEESEEDGAAEEASNMSETQAEQLNSSDLIYSPKWGPDHPQTDVKEPNFGQWRTISYFAKVVKQH